MQYEFFNKKTNKLINCIREVQIDGKMALVSLYDDLPHFEYDLTIENLENANKKLKISIQESVQQIEKLKKENSHFKSVNAVLSKNITSLYKTATTEIQRKDKIIDELRKSQVHASQTSNMISSRNILPLEEAQNKQICEIKKISEENIDAADQSDQLNQKNNDNFSNMVIQPNHDIPKTVYYKRLCQKLMKQNQITEIKKQNCINIQNSSTISIDKITQDKNEEMNSDNSILKENMTASLIHCESKNNFNSTLVVCKSDVSPSDSELNTTPVIQCNENQVIGKENVSLESFPKLKQSLKMKKKMVIAPATIGVQNMLVEKYTIPEDKLSKSKNLDPKIQHDIIDLTKNKTKSINNNPKLTCDDKHETRYNSKTNNSKFSTTNINHNQKSSPSNNDNQIPLKHVEDEHIKVKNKMISQKDINSPALSEVSILSSVSCFSSTFKNELNESTKNIKYEDKSLLKNNEKELCSTSKQKNYQSESILPTSNHKSTEFNRYDKISTKNTSAEIETSLINNTSLKLDEMSTINIEVEQLPIRRKRITIKKYNDVQAFNEVKKSSPVTYISPSINNKFNMSTKNLKCSSTNYEKDLSNFSNQKNNQSEFKSFPIKQDNNFIENTQLNDSVKKPFENISAKKSIETDISSINIEVEQFPIRRKLKVISKDDSTATNEMKKSLSETCARPLNNVKFNTLSKNFKCSSMNNEIKTPNPITQINNKPESKLPSIKQNNSKLTESTKLNNFVESSLKNTSVETSYDDIKSVSSINIEAEQGSIFRRSNSVKVIIHSNLDDSNKETKKGRRVPLITIKDHCSQPLPSFNGAKKTEIDLSKKSIHSEKVVESSSHFYVPQVKRRRTINFGNADS